MSDTQLLEKARQAIVDGLALDEFEGTAYEDLVRRAAELCGSAYAVISVVDGDRLWFKSRSGIDLTERPRTSSFCDHAIGDAEHVTVVEDAAIDARFSSNPNVTGAPHIRFYVGVPLIFHGHPIGTLCAFDPLPRTVDADQLSELRFLADQVMLTLDLRRQGHAAGVN
ncbi:MAG: GAF domain-containing protein [Caldimonas sp.]